MKSKYALGDAVRITLEGEIDGIKMSVQTVAHVRSMRLESDSDTIYVKYGLTRQLPAPYSYGKDESWSRKESEIDGPAEEVAK